MKREIKDKLFITSDVNAWIGIRGYVTSVVTTVCESSITICFNVKI